jgi:hypothetical protein
MGPLSNAATERARGQGSALPRQNDRNAVHGRRTAFGVRAAALPIRQSVRVLESNRGRIDVMLTGELIAESLRRGRALEGITLSVRKISRADVGNIEFGQPLTWTFIDFEAADTDAARLAEALQGVLEPAGGWYCDFRTDDETFVVFANRAFQYPRGDRSGRAEVEDYGRSVGVPEAQLDWPE